jgi:hypothetical protein
MKGPGYYGVIGCKFDPVSGTGYLISGTNPVDYITYVFGKGYQIDSIPGVYGTWHGPGNRILLATDTDPAKSWSLIDSNLGAT